MAKIGFIGLGNMGLPMAKNLVMAGHEVTGFDLIEECISSLVGAGGRGGEQIEDCVLAVLYTSLFFLSQYSLTNRGEVLFGWTTRFITTSVTL